MSYAPPVGTNVPLDFHGSAYTPPGGSAVSGDFGSLPNAAYIGAIGIAPSGVGAAICGNVSPSVVPTGTDQSSYGTPTATLKGRQVITQWTLNDLFGSARASNVRTVAASGFGGETVGSIFSIVLGYYSPPYGHAVPFNFVGGYTPPTGNNLPIDFQNTHVFRQLAPNGVASGSFGTATVYNVAQGAFEQGWQDEAFGAPAIINAEQAVDASGQGIGPGSFGTGRVWLGQQWIKPSGLGSFAAGTTWVSNWHQYVTPTGWVSQAFGTPLFPTFTLAPSGIAPGSFGSVNVSPRILYATGFSGLAWGGPAVQPNPHPQGFESDAYGTPTIGGNQQYITPDPILGDLGQPTATVMRVYLYPPSLVEAGIFGDITVKNLDQFVAPAGANDGAVSEFADVENKNRVLLPYGIDDFGAPASSYSNLLPLLAQPVTALVSNDAVTAITPYRYVTGSTPEGTSSDGYESAATSGAVFGLLQRSVTFDNITGIPIVKVTVHMVRGGADYGTVTATAKGDDTLILTANDADGSNYLLNATETWISGTDVVRVSLLATGAGFDFYFDGIVFHYAFGSGITGFNNDTASIDAFNAALMGTAPTGLESYPRRKIGSNVFVMQDSFLYRYDATTLVQNGGPLQLATAEAMVAGQQIGLEAVNGYLCTVPHTSVDWVVDPATMLVVHHPGFATRATEIWNYAPTLAPPGFDSLTFGTADVGAYVRYVYPTQIAPGTVPTGASIVNLAATVAPPGIAPVADPHLDFIAPAIRYLQNVGLGDTSGFASTTWVSFYTRTFTNIGAGDVSTYGTPDVESTVRTVSEVGKINEEAFGTAWASFVVRSLAPAGIGWQYSNLQFGGPKVQQALQTIDEGTWGVPPGDFGLLTIARNERLLTPSPILGALGVPDVELYRRYVGVRDSGDLSAFGTALVFNSLQFVTEVFDEPTHLLQGQPGTPYVENRNKVILAYGTDTSKVPTGALVANNARVLAPEGNDLTLFGTQFVSFAVRYLQPEGDDMSYFVPWHAVYNASSVLYPSGIPHGYPGTPYAFRDDQTVDLNGTRTLFTEFGDAMVAYAIRTITLDDHNRGIPAGFFPQPTAALWTQYVAPPGIASGVPGGAVLEIHWNIIGTHGVDWSVFGSPYVHNVTPELQVWPWIEEGFGRAYVGLYTRTLDVAGQGITSTQFGSTYVGPRTRYVLPNGILGLKIPLTHDVHFDAPQIPPQQTVLVQPFPGFGITLDPAQYGTPVFNIRSIRVPPWDPYQNGGNPTAWGRPSVRTNVIAPTSVPLDEDYSVGRPSLNPTQYVTNPTYMNNLDPCETFFPQTHHLWPFYLRISEDFNGLLVLPEAIVDCADNPIDPFHRPVFGSPVVTNANRTIAQYHITNDQTYDATVGEQMGQGMVALARRTLFLTGWAGKFGFATLLGGDQEVDVYWEYDDSTTDPLNPTTPIGTQWGNATVAFAPNTSPYVNPIGNSMGSFGTADVELFNRTISVPGYYGFQVTGDTSVHPPVVVYPTGTDTSLFGTTWASFRIRNVDTEGFDMEQWDYEVGSGIFAPMHVWLRYTPAPLGIDEELVPAPLVGIDPNFRGAVAGLGDTSNYGKPRVGACAC